LAPAYVAVRVTFVCDVTVEWLTEKVPVVLPVVIVTVFGAPAAAESELARLTTTPPAGAGPEIATVPVTFVVELP
jgi:hypothetical protein